jgi:hypothetical protein
MTELCKAGLICKSWRVSIVRSSELVDLRMSVTVLIALVIVAKLLCWEAPADSLRYVGIPILPMGLS